MTPRKPQCLHQDEMFRISLHYACRPDHPLVKLAEQMPWEMFEKEFGELYCPDNGRPGLPIRMMVGLLLLKHVRGLSDEEIVEWWLDSPSAQYFCGETHFQLETQLDASSLSRFRQRFLAAIQILANRLAIAAQIASDGSNAQSYSFQCMYHMYLFQSFHMLGGLDSPGIKQAPKHTGNFNFLTRTPRSRGVRVKLSKRGILNWH